MTRLIAASLVAAIVVTGFACGGSEPVESPPLPSPMAMERPTDAPTEEPTAPTFEPVPTATSFPAPIPTPVVAATSPSAVPVPTATIVAGATSPPAVSVPIATTVIVAASTLADTPKPAGYNSNNAMFDILPEFSLIPAELEELLPSDFEEKLDEVVAENDQSLAPFLVEISRFMPTSTSTELVGQALRDLTGQDFAGDDWEEWMDWVGQNRDQYEPPSEYATWKADFYAAIDPRMGQALRSAREFSRIDLSEVVWGGVYTDGIPDLWNPLTITPAEADYIWPGDRVLGVNINGETKAYPLRIVNAHEMVNDTVGGEPISLMW